MEIKKDSQNRLKYIDILKGIGILLMIMGHISFGRLFDKYIHGFHMPIFFFISGYLFKIVNLSFKKFLKKKIKTLLVPYACFGLFNYICWIIFIGLPKGHNLIIPLKSLLWINTESNMPIAGALWFLTCLFIIEITFYFILRICKNRCQVAVTIILISIMGSVYPLISSERLPLAIDVSLVGIGIFYIGYIMRKHSANCILIRNLLNESNLKTIYIFILSTILIFINKYVNMRTITYALIPLFWINSILGILSYWNISKHLNKCKIKIVKVINKEFIYIGENSIVYVCLNQLTIMFVYTMFKQLCIYDSLIIKALIKVNILVISIILLNIVTLLVNKTKLKVLIGKYR
ncbi:acyltransferase family protein [Haloimpatiens sp. FM7330]|uniref:acyltransferase family protein n=1 Tax=Haloimpatiens sp. FM7330 TaxID=3298610 RepID=UPI0036419FC4